MMRKIFKSFLILIPMISILSVLKMYSDFTVYEKNQKIKELLFDIKYKTSEFKNISVTELDSNQLNSLYNINKRFLEVVGKNFLEAELLDARDYIKKRKNINKVNKLLEEGLQGSKDLSGNVVDPLIKGKFLKLKTEIERIKNTDPLEEKYKRISETIEDIEVFKNELAMQRKVKSEGSAVVSGFNQVSFNLDQALLVLNPLLKYKTIDEQLKDGINKTYAEISAFQNKHSDRTQTTFLLALNFVSYFALLLSLMFTFFLYKFYFSKKDSSAHGVKDSFILDDELPEENEKIDLKLQLEILKENLSQYLALINKEGEISWCSRDFLNFFDVSDCQRLATKYVSSSPIWDEIEKTFIKNDDGTLQISQHDFRKFTLEIKNLSSLKYSAILILSLVSKKEESSKDVPRLEKTLKINNYIDLSRFCETWVEQNKKFLTSLSIWPQMISFKNNNTVTYVNCDSADLNLMLKKCFEIISTYFLTNTRENEICLNVSNLNGQKSQIQCFIPDLVFDAVNDSVIKNSKVYPSISSSLKKMEIDSQNLKLEVFLRHILTKDKKHKGGVLVLEFLKDTSEVNSLEPLNSLANF